MKPGETAGRDPIPIVALCLRDAQGRILAQRRPPGRLGEGFWEFPGGKVEPGEPRPVALAREVREELGIEIQGITPFWHCLYQADDRVLALDFFTAQSFHGIPHGVEGQAIAWLTPGTLADRPWLPADRPLVTLLALGPYCGITPRLTRSDPEFIATGFRESLGRGLRFIRVRFAPGTGDSRAEQDALTAWAHTRGLMLALDYADEAVTSPVIHLRADQARDLITRPVLDRVLLGVSVHHAGEIQQAERLAADYLFLGPLAATPSHPDQPGLGWEAWARLARSSRLPVYALGGLGPADLTRARAAGAVGIAGIRAFWQAP